jgi:hypothetical protein
MGRTKMLGGEIFGSVRVREEYKRRKLQRQAVYYRKRFPPPIQ